MSTITRTLFLLFFSFICQHAFASDWAADWAACQEVGGSKAIDACNRLVASGSKSDTVYVRLGLLYEKRGKLILAKEFYRRALEVNPYNAEAGTHYYLLLNSLKLTIQEMDEKGWLEQLRAPLPK